MTTRAQSSGDAAPTALHLVPAGGVSVNETAPDPVEARPTDAQGPDPEQLRMVVGVILDRNPSQPHRAALAAEVAADARAVLAAPVTTRSLRRAAALVSLALDTLEAPAPFEERSQP